MMVVAGIVFLPCSILWSAKTRGQSRPRYEMERRNAKNRGILAGACAVVSVGVVPVVCASGSVSGSVSGWGDAEENHISTEYFVP
jgi:hypothetical protein